MAKKIPRKKESDLKEDLEGLQRYVKDLTLFLPLAFCAVNPLDIILGTNQALQDLVGYKEIEIIGNQIEILFAEKKRLNDFIREVATTKKRIDRELTLLTKDNKRIPVSVSAQARRDENGNFLGYFVTVSDITEIKKFREELEKRVEEKTRALHEKIEELESFNRFVVGRELKMAELKERIHELEERLKKYEDQN